MFSRLGDDDVAELGFGVGGDIGGVDLADAPGAELADADHPIPPSALSWSPKRENARTRGACPGRSESHSSTGDREILSTFICVISDRGDAEAYATPLVSTLKSLITLPHCADDS